MNPLDMLAEEQDKEEVGGPATKTTEVNGIKYFNDDSFSALEALPDVPEGPRPLNVFDMPSEDSSPLQMLDMSEPMGEHPARIDDRMPQDVQARPDAIVTIQDIKKDRKMSERDMMVMERRKIGEMLQMGGKAGEKAARFLYGDELVDQIPKQVIPQGYEDAYIHEGKWFIPGRGEVHPPPKSFIEPPKQHTMMHRGLEFVLPEGMANYKEVVADLFRGDPGMQEDAMKKLTYAALEMLTLKKLPGPKLLEQDTVAGLAFETAKRTLKGIVKTGVTPPRLAMKALAHVDGKLFLPLREQLWEVISWPAKNLRMIPSYGEGGKTIAEVFQPAVERLGKKGLDKTFRDAQAQRQLVTEIGQHLGKQVSFLSPKERLEFGKALRGEQVTSQKVRDIVRGLKKKTHKLSLDDKYKTHFYERLQQSVDNLDFGSSLEGEMPFLDLIAKDLHTNLAERQGIKETQKTLKKIIMNPLLPDSAKALAKDLHNMPASTPEAVQEAARYAMRHSVTDHLKKTPYVKTALGKGDDPRGWMQSKHPLMQGLWVDRDVELELRAMEEIPQIAQRTFNKWFMTPWKTMKVVARPATHFRNMISNTILNDWGGLPFYRLDVYKNALSQMRGKSKAWKEFQRFTGAGGTFSGEEINQLAAGLKFGANKLDTALATFDRLASKPRELYNAEEQWFKFSKFLYNKQKGMEGIEAAYDAMKWTFNYGEVTRATAWTRGYAAPFFTWQSKVLPLMAETMVKHPWRVGKWTLFYQQMQSASLNQLSISQDEWEKFQYFMPDYVQEGQFLLLPMRDEKGRLQMLNLTYMVPGFGDLGEIMAHPAGELIGHPLTVLAGELKTQTKWNGAPLYYDWEAPTTKMMKVFSHVWDAVTPSWMPGAIDWRNMNDTFRETDKSATIEQMLANQVGFKVVPINEMNARRSRTVIDNIHRQEIGASLKRDLRNEPNPNKRQKIIEKYGALRRSVGMRDDE